MKRVLITGGTGFVGYWMRQAAPPDLFLVYQNRENYQLSNWEAGHWDCVIHLAPVLPVRVLAYAAKHNSRVLYASSGIVYHPENHTLYRQMKIGSEAACIESGVDFVTARLFTFYGAHLDENKAITQFLKAAREGKPLRIWGDGNCVRSYMSGEELGKWMWAILLHGESGQAYDVGSDKPVTMLELARFIASHYTPRPPILIENGTDAMPVYLPRDTAKTKALLD